MRSRFTRPAAVLVAAVLVAACGSTGPTPAMGPSGSPDVSAAASAAVTPRPSVVAATPTPPPIPTVAPSPTASPIPAETRFAPGDTVVTTVPDVFMRSQPRIAEDSAAYAPLLPQGTWLEIMDGPTSADGYVWYRARPLSLVTEEGPGYGWVAVGRPDGLWVEASSGTIQGVETAAAADVPRAPADPAAAKEVAASINAFGVDLYRRALAEGTLDAARGAVISPASIVLALAMARAGAKGETAAQLDRILHTSGWDDLAAGLNSLDQELGSHDATFTDEQGALHELTLRIANAAFGQAGWSIEPSYLDALAAAFGAGLQLVDFRGATEAARQAINGWVGERTRGRIPELLPKSPPVVTTLTRLVLVNAIYLKANWEPMHGAAMFEVDRTRDESFTRPDGSTVTVPTMVGQGGQIVPYAHGTGWEATELNFLGPDGTTPLAMTFVLPSDLPKLEASLSSAQLGRIVTALDGQRRRLDKVSFTGDVGVMDCGTYPYQVEVHLPRFGTDSALQLRALLVSLGAPLAFDPAAADFTGLHVPAGGDDRPYISDVIHQANIDVDEKGVEAAAATAVMVGTGGCTGPEPAKTIVVRLDRPFLFAIRDVQTGAILFIGRVTDPGAGG